MGDCWSLLCVQGMVTHVTDVKPLAAVLTYLDEDSNTEIYQEVQHKCSSCLILTIASDSLSSKQQLQQRIVL